MLKYIRDDRRHSAVEILLRKDRLPIVIARTIAFTLFLSWPTNLMSQLSWSSGLSLPMGLAVDTNGNLYVADFGNRRVLKETPTGSAYSQTTVVSNLSSGFFAVAVDKIGNVYVADTYHNRVLKEAPSGTLFMKQ